MILSAILSLLQVGASAVYFGGTMTPEFLNSLDGLALVIPEERVGIERRATTDAVGSRESRVVVDRFRVVHFRGESTAQQLNLLGLPEEKGSSFRALCPPGRYLLVFKKNDRGQARFIQHERSARRKGFELWTAEDSISVSAHPDEVAPFILLPTNAETLRSGSDFTDAVVQNLLECLRGATPESAALVCASLRNIAFVPSSGLAKVVGATPRSPRPYDALIKDVVSGGSPSLRARSEALRSAWDIPDTDFSYYRAIRDAREDSKLFGLPIDIVGKGVGLGDPQSSPNVFIAPDEVAQLAIEHNSLAARTLLIGSMPAPPSREMQVRLLDTLSTLNDTSYNMNVLTRFARWHKDLTKIPRFRNGAIQDRTELLAHWRQFLNR